MRKKIKTYRYQNGEFKGEYPSILEAAEAGGDTPTSARSIILGKYKISKKGNVYTNRRLTQEEIENLPIKEKEDIRYNQQCKVKPVPKIEYEVSCHDHKVCYLPRSKEGKIKMLRKFIYQQMEYKWLTQPKQITALQKRFLQELFDELMIN